MGAGPKSRQDASEVQTEWASRRDIRYWGATLPREELEQLLERQAQFQGWHLELTGRTRATHSETLFYRSRSSPGRPALAVKRIEISSTPEKAAEAVDREFAALSAIRTSIGPALQDTLPAPFLVLPEAGVLVLQKLPGVALNRLLRRKANHLSAPWHRAEIRRMAQRVGAWLGQFHAATRQNPVQHDADAFEASLNLQIEACAKCRLDLPSAEELSRIAVPVSRALHGTPLPAAARHGDFTVRNILIDGDRVAVVDFENFAERDAIYEDLSAFITYMALLKSQPLYSSSALEAASAGFLEGYGRSLSSEVLKLYGLKAAVIALAERRPAKGMRGMLRFDSLYTRQLLRLGSEPPAR